MKRGITALGVIVGATLGCGGDEGRDDASGSWGGGPVSAGLDAGDDDDDDDDDDEGDDDDDDGGGGTKLDVAGADPDDPGGNNECEELIDTADVGPRPQDIIFLIDNSDSMFAEAGFVQQQMNSFSIQIEAANVDAHIVMISGYPEAGSAGVCIDPPLGSGMCPNEDDNPPVFWHVNDYVGSHNALARAIQYYDEYSVYLRPTAVTHIVVVTDDDSDMSAADFTAMFGALSPHLADFVFHGIIAPEDPFESCLVGSSCCGLSADEGKVYIDLINQTGGVQGNLCDQEFQPIFAEVAQQVIGGATLACSYEIPPPPEGEVFDKDEVNVEFDDGQGGTLEIGRVESPADCAGVAHGWYYDDPNDPLVIHVCPQTCDTIQGFAAATIGIIFGCETIPAG